MAAFGGGRRRDPLETVALLAFIVLCAVATWVLAARHTGSSMSASAASLTPPPPPRPTPRTPPPPPPLPKEPVSLGEVTSRGDNGAKVVVIAYSEFKCPYCGAFARDTWPGLLKKYIDPGKVRFIFRHLPLDQLHPFARQAAKAAVCADRQGKFWALHDVMFAHQAALDATELAKDVRAVGLDATRFAACLADVAARRVEADEATARSLGVTGTPTFFVGLVQPDGRVILKERIGGARPIGDFEAALDRWLSAVGSTK